MSEGKTTEYASPFSMWRCGTCALEWDKDTYKGDCPHCDLATQVQRLEKERDSWKMRYESSQEALTEVMAEHTAQSEELDVLKLAEGLQSPVYEQLVADRTRLTEELAESKVQHDACHETVDDLRSEDARNLDAAQQQVNTLRTGIELAMRELPEAEPGHANTHTILKAALATTPSAVKTLREALEVAIEVLNDVHAKEPTVWMSRMIGKFKTILRLATTPLAEEPKNCFKIECDCSAYHPLGGVCECGQDYESNVDHFGKSVPPAYGDGYEQHQFRRAQQPTTETVCPCEDSPCVNCEWHFNSLHGGHVGIDFGDGHYELKHCSLCTTPGCVDGKIQVKESTE